MCTGIRWLKKTGDARKHSYLIWNVLPYWKWRIKLYYYYLRRHKTCKHLVILRMLLSLPRVPGQPRLYDFKIFSISRYRYAQVAIYPITLSRELTKPAIVGRRGASAGHRLCEFQNSWHRPGVVRRADARTTSAGGIKYIWYCRPADARRADVFGCLPQKRHLQQ